METTTIQISRINAARLEEVGKIMQRIFPDLFRQTPPTRDQIVGFLCGQFLTEINDNEINDLAKQWAEVDR